MGGKPIKEGDRFHKLVAVDKVYRYSRTGRRKAHWLCQCDCGGESVVDSGNLRNGNSRWCSACASAYKAEHRLTHGQTSGPRVSKSYQAWQGIKARIFNPNNGSFPDYGGRGIDMDPAWAESFEAFRAEMGDPPTPDHQIERIDNDSGYWPGNCRWADRYEQGANKRNNVLIEWRGKTKTLAEWCRETGTPYDLAKARAYRHPGNGDKIFAEGRLYSARYRVGGVEFNSLSQVAKAHGLSVSATQSRFKSDTFPTWVKEAPP